MSNIYIKNKMKKKSINFSSRLAVAKKISIKALDFEKLPRNLVVLIMLEILF